MLTVSWKNYSSGLNFQLLAFAQEQNFVVLERNVSIKFLRKSRSKLLYYQVTFGFFFIRFHPDEICKVKICGLPNSHPGLESRSIDFGHVQWTISTGLRVMRVQVTTNKYWQDCENIDCGQILLFATQLYLSGDIDVAFAYFHNPGFGGLSGLDFI